MDQRKSINILWGCLIIEELIKNGIDYFCISPGSRSTPLTYAAAVNGGVHKTIFFDERSAAYHALGYAYASGKPAVLICTSGTAAANYYPAIIESSQRNIPLIIFTADRPPELRETGANQTIDQVRLYQSYVRWFYDMPCPTEEIAPEMICSNIDYAVSKAIMPPYAGPVHLNWMFREPLAPDVPSVSESYQRQCDKLLSSIKPSTCYGQSKISLSDTIIKEIATEIEHSETGILVLGELPLTLDKKLLEKLITKLKWPVFPDILSGFRNASFSREIINYYDQILLSDKIQNEIKNLTVLQIGGRITSKRFLSAIHLYKPRKYIMITDHPQRYDPAFKVTARYYSDLNLMLKKIVPLIKTKTKSSLVEKFINYQYKVSDILKDKLNMKEVINEISTAQIISELIPNNWGLFIGNSMPIRDMDMYAQTGSNIFIAANRGASGIDGTLSSATGFARGLGKPVTVILGDLAFLHDLNSLFMVMTYQLPVQIIVINNGGGGIFSFLPVASYKKVFEQFFAAKHSLTFEQAAKLFNISYMWPKTNSDLKHSYLTALKSEKPVLIEIATKRNDNYDYHMEIQNKIISII
jgi:2-succinyl-5-enolpyruvyl-6-hydroxy-3-cyclohexene-1-carboxylate synthase